MNSDDDSDETDSFDLESSSECTDRKGADRSQAVLQVSKNVVVVVKLDLDDDAQPSDDDQTASVADSDATSASDTAFTWSDRATVVRQRFFFIGSPGRKVAIDDI